MATKKQIGLLLARASEKGFPLTREEAAALDNGAVTDMLNDIASFRKQAVNTEQPVKTEKKVELNGQRFGMCYKIISDALGQEYKRLHPDQFCDEVVKEYHLATNAEAKASAFAQVI